MILNYFKIAWRQLWRNRLFSLLNIFGLASGMAVCLLVILILQDQYSYDNFHPEADRIYRVISAKMEGERTPQEPTVATTSRSLVERLTSDYSFVELTTSLTPLSGFFKQGERLLPSTDGGFAVKPAFFELFDFGWSAERGRAALSQPFQVLLTQETATRFFPDMEAVGQEITVDILGSCTIAGVIPNLPRRSHIQFDYLVSHATIDALKEETRQALSIYGDSDIYRSLVYFRVKPETEAAQLEQAMRQLATAYTEKDGQHQYYFEAQPLDKVLPSRDLGNEIGVGTPKIVLTFVTILGLIILLTACFNYTNLSLARSLQRAREIGVRKITGARRRDIIWQFLSEALLIALLALLVAIGLLELLIPAFYGLDPFLQQVFWLQATPLTYTLFFGFSILAGLVAGLLPSLNIARFQPLEALSQLKTVQVFSRLGLRKALVVAQFTLSLIFVLTVIIVLKQQQYVLQADLGLNVDKVLTVNLLGRDYEIFAERLRELPGVETVAGSDITLLTGGEAEVMATYHDGQDSLLLHFNRIGPAYPACLHIELLAGQTFPETTPEGQERFVLLNEQAVQRMGFTSPQAAIGQFITMDSLNLSILGVTKNFHHNNIWFDPIQPFALRQADDAFTYANIRLSDQRTSAVLQAVRDTWDELHPEQPMNSFFVSEQVYYLQRFFRMGARIVGFIGLLTILISCLGLLGMVIYGVQGRIKEVGIRKVLGASIPQIIWQLSKGFLWLLGLAIVLGLPLTLLGASWWLDNFYLRIRVGPVIVLTGIAVVMSLGLLTILSQTFWAARRNPVESLKTE